MRAMDKSAWVSAVGSRRYLNARQFSDAKLSVECRSIRVAGAGVSGDKKPRAGSSGRGFLMLPFQIRLCHHLMAEA